MTLNYSGGGHAGLISDLILQWDTVVNILKSKYVSGVGGKNENGSSLFSSEEAGGKGRNR